MSCLANRVRLGWGTWLEVLDGIPRFSAELNLPTGTPNPWDPIFIKLLHEVEGIFDGSSKDLSNGGVYWCDTRRIETDFFKNKIMNNLDVHARTSEMNTLVTFR